MAEVFKIRIAHQDDISPIIEIYQYYVLHTSITFEYEVPSVAEMEKRMTKILSKYPFIVCNLHDRTVGYAYATDFRFRDAYRWSPESAIYLAEAYHGKSIGRVLYQTLFDLLRLQGYVNVVAGTICPNEKSEALHRRLGFNEIGVYKNIGFKHGEWHSTKWFQMALSEYITPPKEIQSIEEIKDSNEFSSIFQKANLALYRKDN